MCLACKQRQTGFTLIELIIVLLALGIMSAYAVMKNVPAAELTLPSQAQTLASDIRHTQTLAYTTGRSLRLTINACPNGIPNTYCVSCVTAGACSQAFSVTVQKGVVLGGTATVDFSTLGQPSTAASYSLASGGATETVAVAALTGLVTVSP